MKKMFEDEEFYKQLVKQSKNRRKIFSWDKTASKTLKLYSKVLKQHDKNFTCV